MIPPRSNRKTPIEYDREAYKRRNLIERCVNRLKQFRRIATRYEKTARAYLSMLCIAAANWIKTVNRPSHDGMSAPLARTQWIDLATEASSPKKGTALTGINQHQHLFRGVHFVFEKRVDYVQANSVHGVAK